MPLDLIPPPALATLYSFPSLEPLQFLKYQANQLNLPLRKDILHRAVVYEGDKTRQGTASTKWRSEVHGSNRKIRPQKGSGRARLGDKKSPMLVGGGVAFGPKPRDFSTGLNKKIYDLAFRTALSYRWRKGELVVVDDLKMVDVVEKDRKYWLKYCFEQLGWSNKHGRSFLVMGGWRTKAEKEMYKRKPDGAADKSIFRTLNEECGAHGRARLVDDVDVKNLLEMGRLVIEQSALTHLLREHSSDLTKRPLRVKGLGSGLTTAASFGEVEGVAEEMAGLEDELFEEELDMEDPLALDADSDADPLALDK
jgi:large subunit ribosomal protein L4